MRFVLVGLHAISCCITAFLAKPLVARNVDLSTVPPRDMVQLTIYNAEDLTLVRELRHVTFKKGVNPLQFSWANTLIDPTSVHLRFPKHEQDFTLLDTTFPHDKPQMLYWNVESTVDAEAVVEISYFTSGITWSADYVCIANPDETKMEITGFVQVLNNSGEEYENAQVRLVVGTINLTEKIAELAKRRYGRQPSDKERQASHELRLGVIREELEDGRRLEFSEFGGKDRRKGGGFGGGGGYGGGMLAPKEVEKEGLGEYFIYTIEGTETIPNGWAKRMRSFEAPAVPIRIQYRYREEEYGDELVRMFLVKNNKEAKLGTTPLPNGTVRTYRENGRGGLAFLAEQEIKYIPIGDEIELNLGPDPEVIHEQVTMKTWRDHFEFKVNGVDVYRGKDGKVAIEADDEVAGWQDHVRYVERIRNYRGKPIEVEIRRVWAGHVTFISRLNPKLHDYQTTQITAICPPGRKTDLPCHVATFQEHLAKQENVTLESGE